MKKGIIILIGIIIASVAAYFIFQSKEQPANTTSKETKTKTIKAVEKLDTPIRPGIEPDHAWKFPFKKEIDKNTVQNKVYILNEEQQRVPVRVEVNKDEITINPPQDGYGKDKTYELFVEKDIKYVDGNNIEPVHFTFISKRDEVAKGTFRNDLIKINKEQIDKVKENSITLKDSTLKGKLKKDSMIVILTGNEQEPEIARKVSSVKEGGNKLTIDTTTPKFEELFDELDLYKDIPITAQDIKLDPIDGLTLSNVNTGLTASTDPIMYLAEGKGSIINFNNVSFKAYGYEVTVKGTVDFKNGRVSPDVKVKNESIDRFHMYLEQSSETDLTVSVKHDKTEFKKNIKPFEKEKKFHIGNFKVPTGIPLVNVKGEFFLVIELTASGELKASIRHTITDRVGFKNNNGDIKTYNDLDVDLKDVQVYGEGKVGAEAGPGIGASLSALEVFSAGIEGRLGGYIEGSIVAPASDIENSCGNIQMGYFGSGELYLKAFPSLESLADYYWGKIWGKGKEKEKDKELDYAFAEKIKFIDEKKKTKEWDSCKITKDFLSDPKEVTLKSGEEKDIGLILQFFNKGTSKDENEKLEEADEKYISVRSKQKDVVEAKVTKSGKVKLIANDMPSQQSTEVEVTYNNKEKDMNKTVTIPVKITDFNPMSLEQLNGYWRDEKVKTNFVKIDKKGAKNIEYTAMDTHEIWYTGNVQFDTVKQKALSGNMKYLVMYGEDYAESLPEEAFKLEVVNSEKITVTKGNEVFNLRKSSTKEYEKEQLAVVGGTEETNIQPKQNTKLDGSYINAQSDSKIYLGLQFTMTDDKNAKVAVEQRTNNSNGITTSLMGLFETNAVKQNDSTWAFSWTDNNGTKGTGTITFQGENPTIDLKGERDKLSEGRGIVNQKVTLKKSE
ncbi:hypothetical protein [Bacillus cereus]